jgi:hypothetical protein
MTAEPTSVECMAGRSSKSTSLCGGATSVKTSLHKLMDANAIKNKRNETFIAKKQALSAEKRLWPKDVAGLLPAKAVNLGFAQF